MNIQIKEREDYYEVTMSEVSGTEETVYFKNFVTFRKPTFSEIRKDFKANNGEWIKNVYCK